MVRLRLIVEVLPPESTTASSASPPRPLSRDRHDVRKFLEIVDDPGTITIDALQTKIGQRYLKIYKEPLRTKYLRDGHDETDLDPDMTVEDAFVDSGKAAKDPSDQHAIIRITQNPAPHAPARFESVVPEWSGRPPVPRFDDPRPALGRRARDEAFGADDGRPTSSFGAASAKRLRHNPLQDITPLDQPVSSIERDEPPPTKRRLDYLRNGHEASQLLIEDSQPENDEIGPTRVTMDLTGAEDEPKSESPEAPSDPHSFPPTTRGSKEIPESQGLDVADRDRPTILEGLTEAAQREPSELPQQDTQNTAQRRPRNGLTPNLGQQAKGTTPITPPSDTSMTARKLKHPSSIFKRTEPRIGGIRKTPARRSDEVLDPMSEIEVSQEVRDADPAKRKSRPTSRAGDEIPESSKSSANRPVAKKSRKAPEREPDIRTIGKRDIAWSLEHGEVYQDGVKRVPEPPNYEVNMDQEDEHQAREEESAEKSGSDTASEDSSSEPDSDEANKENHFDQALTFQGDKRTNEQRNTPESSGQNQAQSIQENQNATQDVSARAPPNKASKKAKPSASADYNDSGPVNILNGLKSGESARKAQAPRKTPAQPAPQNPGTDRNGDIVESIEAGKNKRAGSSKPSVAVEIDPKAKPKDSKTPTRPSSAAKKDSGRKTKPPKESVPSPDQPHAQTNLPGSEDVSKIQVTRPDEDGSNALSHTPKASTPILPPHYHKIPEDFVKKLEQKGQGAKIDSASASKPSPGAGKSTSPDKTPATKKKPGPKSKKTPNPEGKGNKDDPSKPKAQRTPKPKPGKGKTKVVDLPTPQKQPTDKETAVSSDNPSVHSVHDNETEGAAGPSSRRVTFERSESETTRKQKASKAKSGNESIADDVGKRKKTVNEQKSKATIKNGTTATAKAAVSGKRPSAKVNIETRNSSQEQTDSEEEAVDVPVAKTRTLPDKDTAKKFSQANKKSSFEPSESEEGKSYTTKEKVKEKGSKPDTVKPNVSATQRISLSEKDTGPKSGNTISEEDEDSDVDAKAAEAQLLGKTTSTAIPAKEPAPAEDTSSSASGSSYSECESSEDEEETSPKPVSKPAVKPTAAVASSLAKQATSAPGKPAFASSSQPRTSLSSLKAQAGLSGGARPGVFPVQISSLKSPNAKGPATSSTLIGKAQAQKDREFSLGSDDDDEDEDSDSSDGSSDIVKNDKTPPLSSKAKAKGPDALGGKKEGPAAAGTVQQSTSQPSHKSPVKSFLDKMWWTRN